MVGQEEAAVVQRGALMVAEARVWVEEPVHHQDELARGVVVVALLVQEKVGTMVALWEAAMVVVAMVAELVAGLAAAQ